jgi:hypothetical protein
LAIEGAQHRSFNRHYGEKFWIGGFQGTTTLTMSASPCSAEVRLTRDQVKFLIATLSDCIKE